MQELVQKIKTDDIKLKQNLQMIAAKNFSNMTIPCYFPPHKEMYNNLLYLTKISDTEVKQFVRNTWSGRKEANFKILNDPPVLFLILIMYYFLNKGDNIGFRSALYVYMIRFYSNLAHKSFPFGCQQDVFKYALNTLNKTHLFIREKTIPNAILFLSKEMERIWSKDIKEWNLDGISRFIQDSRTRISQSLKSFAENYYRVHEKGIGIDVLKSDVIEDEDEPERGEGFISTYQDTDPKEKLIDPVVKKFVIYRFIDQQSFSEALKLHKVNEDLARKLVQASLNLKYSNNLKLIYKLFLKDISDLKYICGRLFFDRIKNLLSLKRTKQQYYFKKEVQILVDELIKDIKLTKKYSSMNKQIQFSIISFFATYLLLVFRNTHC